MELPSWFFKYKVLHFIMWFLVIGISLLAYYNPSKSFMSQVANTLCVSGLQIIPFYLCAYVMVPELLYKRKFAAFIITFILLVVAMGIFTLFITRIVAHLFAHTADILPTWTSMAPSLNLFIWNSILAAFGSSGLKILSDRFRIESRLKIVEEEKIVTELSFLRSQINPHFLFNIMNTIYFQIDKNNSGARLSVEKFSEMLRYQLYECTTDKIQIDKELNYIKNYVAIQTLRMEKESDIKLHIQEPLGDFYIAPFLILPVIENAFKHVSNYKDADKNKIYINLKANSKYFFIEAMNTFEQNHTGKHLIESGGLGIQNLKRRLQLLYPGKHQLDIDKNESDYRVLLKLEYED